MLMVLGMFMYVHVMSFLMSVCSRFLCEFCFLYCDDIWWRVMYEVFSSWIFQLVFTSYQWGMTVMQFDNNNVLRCGEGKIRVRVLGWDAKMTKSNIYLFSGRHDLGFK